MTTGASNDENESSHDAEGFRGFMEMMGVKVVKRMGTARELASVSSLFLISILYGSEQSARDSKGFLRNEY